MRFGEALKHNLVKPFEGRASRSEYWWLVVWYLIIFLVPYLILLSTVFGASNFDLENPENANLFAGIGLIAAPFVIVWAVMIYWIAVALFCAAMRRLHDTDRSAWWALIGIIPLIGPIILIVFMCLRGTTGPNRFGEDPLQPVDADVFR